MSASRWWKSCSATTASVEAGRGPGQRLHGGRRRRCSVYNCYWPLPDHIRCNIDPFSGPVLTETAHRHIDEGQDTCACATAAAPDLLPPLPAATSWRTLCGSYAPGRSCSILRRHFGELPTKGVEFDMTGAILTTAAFAFLASTLATIGNFAIARDFPDFEPDWSPTPSGFGNCDSFHAIQDHDEPVLLSIAGALGPSRHIGCL